MNIRYRETWRDPRGGIEYAVVVDGSEIGTVIRPRFRDPWYPYTPDQKIASLVSYRTRADAADLLVKRIRGGV